LLVYLADLYLECFLNKDEVRRLAPIAVVMLPEAVAFARWRRQHLNG